MKVRKLEITPSRSYNFPLIFPRVCNRRPFSFILILESWKTSHVVCDMGDIWVFAKNCLTDIVVSAIAMSKCTKQYLFLQNSDFVSSSLKILRVLAIWSIKYMVVATVDGMTRWDDDFTNFGKVFPLVAAKHWGGRDCWLSDQVERRGLSHRRQICLSTLTTY